MSVICGVLASQKRPRNEKVPSITIEPVLGAGMVIPVCNNQDAQSGPLKVPSDSSVKSS
jgi:hypothetical protein